MELTGAEENCEQAPAQPPNNSHRCFRRCFLARCRTPTEGWVVGAGIRQCAARLTFGAGHGIRCGCGTRRKVSAAASRRNHRGSSTSRLGLGWEGTGAGGGGASSAHHQVFHHNQRLWLLIMSPHTSPSSSEAKLLGLGSMPGRRHQRIAHESF